MNDQIKPWIRELVADSMRLPKQGRKSGYWVDIKVDEKDLAATGSRTEEGFRAYVEKLVGRQADSIDSQTWEFGTPNEWSWIGIMFFSPTREEAQTIAQKVLEIPRLKVEIVKETGVDKEKSLTTPLES